MVGKSQAFSVSVTNNGTLAWPATGYTQVDLYVHFATSAGGAANQRSWLDSKGVALTRNVAPGQTVALTVTIAPASVGLARCSS